MKEKKKVRKCKSSPNLEYTCKTEINITINNSIHSSTRTVSKRKINDQCIMNDQINARSSWPCRNYYEI